MDIEIKTWLFDIQSSIMEIDSFFTDIPKEYSSYNNDLRTKRAVERSMVIKSFINTLKGSWKDLLHASFHILSQQYRRYLVLRNSLHLIHTQDDGLSNS